MATRRYLFRGKLIITLSVAFLVLSIIIQIKPIFANNDLDLAYNYINIKDVAVTDVSMKDSNSTILDNLFAEVKPNDLNGMSETKLGQVENTVATTPQPTWRLPTEVGYVTQNPSYGHVALDISSPRGTGENIFPIANGVISGIYRDGNGALIVTIYHNINGQDYTSQYVHLSRYAPNLYVGKPVTVNDSIGLMGSTGYSTGVHLHVTLLDCHLFDPSDTRCPDLNSFFRYANSRYNQGYFGMWAVMYIPGSWTSR